MLLDRLWRRKTPQPGASASKLPMMLLAGSLLAGGAVGLSNFGFASEPAKSVGATSAAVSVADAPNAAASAATEADVALPKRLRLLTTQQYLNTVRNFFGPDITVDQKFAPLPRTAGVLMAGTSVAGIGNAQVEQYQKIASLLSRQVVDEGHRSFLVTCKPADDKAADDACAGKFLTEVVGALYVLPAPKEHVAKLVAEAGSAANQMHDFYGGLQVVLETILMSPDVVLVVENQEAVPNRPGQFRLDADSQAARLSLFLWNAAPDAALRAAARRGDLFDPKKRGRIVDAMLASPRLETGVRSFFDDILGLEGLETVNKEAQIYPYFLAGLQADAREQTLRTVVDLLLNENGDYRDIFTTRKTFMSQGLGILYDVNGTPGWTPYEFPPESHRMGILTHASFLAMNSHASRSSPTLRGKAFRELILCQIVPPPPPDVDFSAVENPDPSLRTARLRLTAHQKNPGCAGCHRVMDPLGLALENFDGAGRYREHEKGAAIDVSGTLDGKSFSDIEQLAQAVHDNPGLPKCVARRALTYGTAGPLPRSAEPVVNELTNSFIAGGYRLRPLLRAIAMSPAFSGVVAPKTEIAGPKSGPAPEKTAGVSLREKGGKS